MLANLTDPTIRARVETVQEFPPPGTQFIGAALSERGALLPAFASRDCDAALRALYRHQYNTLVQGAFTGLAKKISSAPYKIEGEDEAAVRHYQDVFQFAHFGAGWAAMISRVIVAYLTQNIGAFIEVIGPGNPDEPLIGAVSGIAALDPSRCYLTGQPDFPVIYFSQWTGKLHRMHKSRVIRLVDMPDYEERLYGYGMCALYRAAAVSDRQIKMGQYISAMLDDRPKPGIMQVSGATRDQVAPILNQYAQRRYNDAQDVWGQTLWVYGIDPTNPVKIEALSFATTPDKFDFTAYTNLDVNALALALGVDKQELWELTGGNLGSGAQSIILAAKARGKALGDLFTQIERAINLFILPESLEFSFDFQDDEANTARAQIDAQHMAIAQQMAAMQGVFTPQQIKAYLMANSKTIRDALIEGEKVTAIDDDRPIRQDVVAEDTGQTEPVTGSPAPPSPPPSGGGAAPSERVETARKDLSTAREQLQKALRSGGDPVKAVKVAGDLAYREGRGETPDAMAEMALYAWLEGLKGEIAIYRRTGATSGLFDALTTPYEMGRADANRSQFVNLLSALFGAAAGWAGDKPSRADFIRRLAAVLQTRGRAAFLSGLRDGGKTAPDEGDQAAFNEWLKAQGEFIDKLATEIYTTGISEAQVKQRAELWANKSLQDVYQIGLQRGAEDNARYEWVLGATVDHCADCLRLNGQIHTMKEWQGSGYMPQSRTLECGGWQCLCRLVKTDAAKRGQF